MSHTRAESGRRRPGILRPWVIWTGLAIVVLVVAATTRIGIATSPGPSVGGPCGNLIAGLSAEPVNRHATALTFGFADTVSIPNDIAITSLYCWDRSDTEGSGFVDAVMAIADGGDQAWLILSEHARSKFASSTPLDWEAVIADYGFGNLVPTEYGFGPEDRGGGSDLWSQIEPIALGGS